MSLAQTAPVERVVLAPHRAVYDLKLDTTKPSRSVDGARGRIAFDFTGDVCEGYALSFRQVTVIESVETGSRNIDVRTTNFEDGDGKLFRFKTQAAVGSRMDDRVDGVAEQRERNYRVQIRQPKADRFEFGADVVFPSEHLKRVIQAARAGSTTYNVQVYDGSDEGKQVYDTFAVIGRKLEPGPLDKLEEAIRKPEMANQARWPVSISYFKAGSGEVSPSYAISFDLFENGVTRALVLDYRDFRMTGELVKLDMMKPSACAK
ncbi:MAG: cell envelope integrity EipB family protein [Bosea sp. (in: a-proteobacteria)]